MNFLFLNHVKDHELRGEIHSVLNRLACLSDVGAMTYDKQGGRSSETPLGPPGFRNLSSRKCPPADRSLFDHYRFRFEQLVSEDAANKRLWFCLWSAEHDLKIRTVPPDGDHEDRTALTMARADETAIVKHLLSNYRGAHSYMVALDMNISQGWVERHRELNGHDPIMGEPRPQWKLLDRAERQGLVDQARADGLTQAEAAVRLGVSRSTLANYWSGKVAA